MDTGIISVLLHQLSNPFHGLPIISTIVFVINIVVFSTVSTLILIRLACSPKKTLVEYWRNPEHTLFFPALSIAFATLYDMVTHSCAEAWGGILGERCGGHVLDKCGPSDGNFALYCVC